MYRFRTIINIALLVICLVLISFSGDGYSAIDISHHNTDVEAKLEKYKPHIVIAKASEGVSFKDPKFNDYFQLCQKRKILFGAYHFLSFDKDIKNQFQNFCSVVKVGNNQYKIALKPVLDVERNSGKQTPEAKEIRRMVKEFGQLCYKEFGCYPIIYCNEIYRWYYFAYGFREYTFWIRNTIAVPLLPCAIHQYKEDKGINLDFNRINDISQILM